MPVMMVQDRTWVAMDVSHDEAVAAILPPGVEAPLVERVFHDVESVVGLMRRLGDRRQLRVCYEAGPTGYGLARALGGIGIDCVVIAPARVPKAAASRIKTDRRDARELVGLFRAGLLTPIRIPNETVYVGESDNLRRRISHYRNPGPTQRTNIRINDRIRSQSPTLSPVRSRWPSRQRCPEARHDGSTDRMVVSMH